MSDRNISRRDAIGLVGAGIAAAGMGGSLVALAAEKKPAKQTKTAKKKPIIRTLLKDIEPESLGSGSILFHEHLSIRYPVTKAMAEKQGIPVPANFTDDVGLMVEETKAAGADGVACIVDGGHPDMDRNLDALLRIARESGVHIVGSGGYYMDRNYPPDVLKKSGDAIAEDLVREAIAQHLGALGEIGQQGAVLTENERKVFAAVGKAHVQTGLPVFTHNAYTGRRIADPPVPPDAALRQLDILEAVGCDPKHVCIGHVCCLDDPKATTAIQLARRGVFVGFDRVTIQIIPDSQKVTTLMALADAGYLDNILIASDFSNARGLKKNGGAGIAQAVTVFGPMLIQAGMKEETVRKIFVDNARRFLSFTPMQA